MQAIRWGLTHDPARIDDPRVRTLRWELEQAYDNPSPPHPMITVEAMRTRVVQALAAGRIRPHVRDATGDPVPITWLGMDLLDEGRGNIQAHRISLTVKDAVDRIVAIRAPVLVEVWLPRDEVMQELSAPVAETTADRAMSRLESKPKSSRQTRHRRSNSVTHRHALWPEAAKIFDRINGPTITRATHKILQADGLATKADVRKHLREQAVALGVRAHPSIIWRWTEANAPHWMPDK
jgi:hypothetical protein